MIVILKNNNGSDSSQTKAFTGILHDNNARLIDGSMLPDMARVEIDNRNIVRLKSNLGKKWDVFPEKKYSVPTTKRKLRQ